MYYYPSLVRVKERGSWGFLLIILCLAVVHGELGNRCHFTCGGNRWHLQPFFIRRRLFDPGNLDQGTDDDNVLEIGLNSIASERERKALDGGQSTLTIPSNRISTSSVPKGERKRIEYLCR